MPSNDPGQQSMPSGKAEDIVVFITRHDGKCSECKAEFFRGNFIRVENGQPLCLDCADLGHLEFLPRGDVAITRRATKHSPLRAVVVEWSRSRQRYERQGILVTGDAIRAAEREPPPTPHALCGSPATTATEAQFDKSVDSESTYPMIACASQLMSTGLDAQTSHLIFLDRGIN